MTTTISSPDVQSLCLTDTPKKLKNPALEKVYQSSPVLSRHHQRNEDDNDRCSINEFVNRRRQILMLNMSISTQQEEIEKLHADIERRESKLQEKEDSFYQEQKRFDALLVELDQNALQAATLLDEQMQVKASKEKALKEQSHQLQIAESSLRMQHDNVEKCKLAKKVVQNITPGSHIEEQVDEKRNRQKERRRLRIERRKEAYRAHKYKQMKPNMSRRQSSKQSVPEPVPEFDDEPLTSSDEECPLFFGDSRRVQSHLQMMEAENASLKEKVKADEVLAAKTTNSEQVRE